MAHTIDKKTGEITINSWEKGIAPSPHSGIANIQNANISTEQGEVMASFGRVQQTVPYDTGTGDFTAFASDHIIKSTVQLLAGTWVTIVTSTITNLTAGSKYYVTQVSGNFVYLSATYGGANISTFGVAGSATFTITLNMKNPVSSATETYFDGSVVRHRYYILAYDSVNLQGEVWMYDSGDSVGWRLPSYTGLGGTAVLPGTNIAILNGWLLWFNGTYIYCKSTSILGVSWTSQKFTNVTLTNNNAPHFALTGHQGKLYYTDGNYIGSIFPDSTLTSGGSTTTVNVQSYASYTASTTTGTLTLIGGSIPVIPGTTQRIPAVFFSDNTIPSALTAGTMYYIKSITTGTGITFEVYAAPTGGAAINIQTGAVGNQYFNTFYPLSGGAGFGGDTILFSPQRLNLPSFEIAQYLAEVGNTVIIGCASNILYPWNQISALPSDLIPLPESNVQDMVTVNNMAYIFAGSKGNVYVTNGNTASIVIKVPDYSAGIAGTPSSYIEPYFSFGDAIYIRGRVYFSVQDQTASKTGNCSGIYSFIPTQNLYIGQDTGLSLRLENQSSYGSYNGICHVLLASQEQDAISPQYWSGWRNSYSDGTSTLFGIDGTATHPVGTTIVETDLIATGTALDKKTFSQIEYKLSTPLVAGETVTISYRQNSTDAWTSCGTAVEESTTPLSGYFPVNFEKGQWLQLQITLTPLATTATSFCRLKEIIVR